jgi:O-antigen/teichoic acid export membrane protein
MSASAVNFVGAIITYTLVVYLATLGSNGAYADFLYSLTWALLLSSLLDVASEAVFVKYARHSNSLKKAFSVVLSLRIIGLLTMVILFAAINILFGIVDFKVLILMVPMFYLGPVFEYLNKNLIFVIILCLEKILLFTVLYIATRDNGFTDAVYLYYFLVNVVSLLWQVLFIRKDLGFVKKGLLMAATEYAKLYYAMFLVLQLNLVYGYYTRLIIEARNGMEAFASAAIALQIINMASLFQSQVDRSFRTPIFKAIESQSNHELVTVIKQYVMYSTIPIIFGCFFLYYTSGFVGEVLFPTGYSGLVSSLEILSLIPFSVNMIRLGDALYTGTHKNKINMIITLIAVSMLVFFTLILRDEPIESYLIVLVVVHFFHGLVSVLLGFKHLTFLTSKIVK